MPRAESAESRKLASSSPRTETSGTARYTSPACCAMSGTSYACTPRFPPRWWCKGSGACCSASRPSTSRAGSVRDMYEKKFPPWTEDQVRHRVRQLLKPLALLHDMGVSHRDVTPGNVFIGNNKVLKLGDFGITKAQLNVAGVKADAFAPYFAPPDLGTWWRPADDVYQVGLLMCTLLTGEEVGAGIGLVEVNTFTEHGRVREAIKAALRVKSKRPKTAAELSAMLGKANWSSGRSVGLISAAVTGRVGVGTRPAEPTRRTSVLTQHGRGQFFLRYSDACHSSCTGLPSCSAARRR
ncbi:MAG: protein kinase domain-containing protein [Marmoricola sp.]